MAPISGLRPDAWRVLSRIPFTTMYGIQAPVRDEHPFFGEMNEYPLQRVPSSKKQHRFQTNRSINYVAALLAATGEQLPDELACHVCSNPSAGQWQGCIVPASPEFVETFRFGCANCYYHGNRARCDLDPACRGNITHPPISVAGVCQMSY